MLVTRTLAALAFAPALLFLLVWGGRPLEIACFALALLMLSEYAWLSFSPRERSLRLATVAIGLLYAASALKWLTAPSLGALVVLGTLFFWVMVLADPEPLDTAMRRVGLAAVGAIYGGTLIVFLARLRDLPNGIGWGLMALFCTWGADTSAYFAGRFFGRHKLYPRVSPGKTVEGLIGAVVGAVAVALAIRWVFKMPVNALDLLVLGLIGGIVGAVGDLSESLLKRSVGAKDSSHLIPGHGGVLDRFDAVLFVAPTMYYYVVGVVAAR